MEDGSLLEEALRGDHDRLKNAVTIDAYIVRQKDSQESTASTSDVDSERRYLMEILHDLNHHIECSSRGYPWFVGLPPRFELCVENDRIPFLRATCTYGLQVVDEWKLIALMLEYSTNHRHPHCIAIECWDGDDGQVILIESAAYLPDWVDSVDCRHRCWIYNGQVRLIPPDSVPPPCTVACARIYLSSSIFNVALCLGSEGQINERITAAIQETIQRRVARMTHTHRAAIFLPQSLAEYLLPKYPSLVCMATKAFMEMDQPMTPQASSSNGNSETTIPIHPRTVEDMQAGHQSRCPSFVIGDHCKEKWVWTVLTFGRTHYAILRQFASTSWPTIDYIPPWLAEQEQQHPTLHSMLQLKMSQLPVHVKYGVFLGIRILVGLDVHRKSVTTNHGSSKDSNDNTNDVSLMDWSRFCNDWLQFRDGKVTGVSVIDNAVHEYVLLQPPSADQVDDEAWMLVSEEEMKDISALNSTPIDNIRMGVEAFMSGKSDINGVETMNCLRTSSTSSFSINPTIVLNLLHATLKASSAEDLILPSSKIEPPKSSPNATHDPFFSERDYRIEHCDVTDDEDDSSSESSDYNDREEDAADDDDDDIYNATIQDFMQAMDQELQRSLDVRDGDLKGVDDPETIESMHLLSNLLQSLESTSESNTGPLQSMLREMGIQIPDESGLD